MLTNER